MSFTSLFIMMPVLIVGTALVRLLLWRRQKALRAAALAYAKT